MAYAYCSFPFLHTGALVYLVIYYRCDTVVDISMKLWLIVVYLLIRLCPHPTNEDADNHLASCPTIM